MAISKKQLLTAGAIALGTFAAVQLLKGKKPVAVVKKTAQTVVSKPTEIVAEPVKAATKEVKKVFGNAKNAPAKGSESAKAWAAKMKAAREAKKAKAIEPTSKPSEVHEAVKGLRSEGGEKAKASLKKKRSTHSLSQDQKLDSQEPHEVKYRKIVGGFK